MQKRAPRRLHHGSAGREAIVSLAFGPTRRSDLYVTNSGNWVNLFYTNYRWEGGKDDRHAVCFAIWRRNEPAPARKSGRFVQGGDMTEVVDEDVNVLFIEDDPAVAEMYKLKLELDGYRVTVAKSGEEGLDHAKNQVPDIVFLDIRLPKMDGFAVLENLRSDGVTKNIPVIILSNYGEKELVDRGLKLGALDYLIKSETTPASLSRGVQDWVKE
jgi:CheY-like chemotaxis protein